MPARFFYDSYAVLAFTSGNQAYKEYFEKNDGVLTKLNLLEVFYRSLEQFDSKAASDILDTFSKYLIDFGLEDIAGSMKTRLELKRAGRNISYADALGYFLSRKLAIRFLTGDKTFRGLSGVEYVV
ncbi:MAG: type II toxin-antitoxin system VapC family toxin [Thaumarchaeota archaeon]|nr:type II toxin-antitoxin system VapC family toxin [Nitrososphaerota archaeon]